jgi:hypothetical protein
VSVYLCDHCDDWKDGDYNVCSEGSNGGLICEDCAAELGCVGCGKLMSDESELMDDYCPSCHYENEQKQTAKTLEH